MKAQKPKIIGYVTQEEKEHIVKRAHSLGMTIGAYIAEISMWDNRFDLIPQLRKGGNIICNGTKTT